MYVYQILGERAGYVSCRIVIALPQWSEHCQLRLEAFGTIPSGCQEHVRSCIDLQM